MFLRMCLRSCRRLPRSLLLRICWPPLELRALLANPRAEQKLRDESNGGPPDVHGSLRNARSESSQIGSHHELLNFHAAGSDSSAAGAGAGAAPAEGHNPDFDAKVRLLQQRIREVRIGIEGTKGLTGGGTSCHPTTCPTPPSPHFTNSSLPTPSPLHSFSRAAMSRPSPPSLTVRRS